MALLGYVNPLTLSQPLYLARPLQLTKLPVLQFRMKA